MTGEHPSDIRPGETQWNPICPWRCFTVYSEHLGRRALWDFLRARYENLIFVHADNTNKNGFFPGNEEGSSNDPDLPQAQDIDALEDEDLEQDSPPRELRRANARAPPSQLVAHRGGKRPRNMFAWSDHHAVSADSEDEGDEVSLAKYFKKKRVSKKVQVLLCRSYASYLANQIRARKHKIQDEDSE